jgi:hypothetical protein
MWRVAGVKGRQDGTAVYGLRHGAMYSFGFGVQGYLSLLEETLRFLSQILLLLINKSILVAFFSGIKGRDGTYS